MPKCTNVVHGLRVIAHCPLAQGDLLTGGLDERQKDTYHGTKYFI